jgi:hypothetical protein
MVTYEWVVEVMEGYDIVDTRAWTTLAEAQRDAQGEQYVIVLVRNVWGDGGLDDRAWAYPVDGVLPAVLTDASGRDFKVPQKYAKEWATP